MSMQRTTIMLPTSLKLRAMQRAGQMGISLGEFIRRSLSTMTRRSHAPGRRDPLFADEAVYRGPAPRDLSAHHDRYLYGDAS